MNKDKQKLEIRWRGKHERENPEPRLLVKKDTYLSERKGENNNLLIYGDNLLGLKALERDYRKKIKCIYIDPPYNTRRAIPKYKDNLEHSVWLNMMQERLIVMHDLLKSDGSLWISIDDRESHYLKVVCDEIFGRKNFVANVIWEKKSSPQNDAKWLSDNHDHILVYAKNKKIWRPTLLPRTEEMNSRYKNPDNDPRGRWMPDNLSVKTYSPSCDYPITTPSGRDVYPPKGRCWRFSKKRFLEYLQDNRIWFGKEGKHGPTIKRFLSEVKDGLTALTLWKNFRPRCATCEKCVKCSVKKCEFGDNKQAKHESKVLHPDDPFPTPKPEKLLQRIIYLATKPGDIVLDSFAGSGTTGAVAHKMKRRWIMIELEDHCHTHIIPRLEKVIGGEDDGGVTKAEDVNWKGGGGFDYYELAPSLLEKNLFN